MEEYELLMEYLEKNDIEIFQYQKDVLRILLSGGQVYGGRATGRTHNLKLIALALQLKEEYDEN